MTETALNWRKSTYSGNDNDACVEVADNVAGVHVRDTKDHARGEVMAAPAAWAAFTAYAAAQSPWRKSTYSGPENDNCVEVADDLARVHVRDTKDHAKGELTAAPAAWAAFTGFVAAQAR
ncbi:DUF397 domain-containing protein [Streptomyces sp. NPDC093249]|uniref:DUF397 domain-containing protein n=1 Tax=unclassified Streptomyces TaxID=2593676 RepID=UPI00382D5D51